jgi:hypothetical protein
MGMETEWRLRIMTKVGAEIMKMAVWSVKEKARRLEGGRRGN